MSLIRSRRRRSTSSRSEAPLRIEVRAAFAQRERRQAVLEHLLEAQKLEDAAVHGRIEAKTALVRAECVGELQGRLSLATESGDVSLTRLE